MKYPRGKVESTRNKFLSYGLICLVIVAGLVTLIGSGGDGDITGNNTGNTANVSLGADFKNVLVTPNTETQIAFTYTIPNGLLSDPLTSYDSFLVDLDATMQNISVTGSPIAMNDGFFQKVKRFAWSGLINNVLGIENALAAVNAYASVYVSFPGDPAVCTSSISFGPFSFSGDVGTQPTSDSASATTGAINTISTGSFEMCIVISPLAIPASAYISVSDVAVEAIPCDQSPPADADVLGGWSGTYSCTNFGTGSETDLAITLTISKNNDGSYSYIDDGGAMYEGHFCGNVFRHSGGVDSSYTESGTFTLEGGGVATKTSTWNSTPAGFSGGDCEDDLTKD